LLDALGIAAGLPGAEQNCGHAGRRGKPSQEREHIAKQPALDEQPNQRRPLRRSSMRAYSLTPCDRPGRRRHYAQAVVEDALDVGDIGLQRAGGGGVLVGVMALRFSLVIS
jgi:hypothetical protein